MKLSKIVVLGASVLTFGCADIRLIKDIGESIRAGRFEPSEEELKEISKLEEILEREKIKREQDPGTYTPSYKIKELMEPTKFPYPEQTILEEYLARRRLEYREYEHFKHRGYRRK